MKRKERDIPNDQSVDPTKPFRFTNRHSIYKQANGEFLARRFRLEFETFTAGPPLCKKQLWNASSTSNELKQHSKKSKFVSQGKQKQLRKRKYPSYTEMRKEREEFRKCLVSLIMSKPNEDRNDNSFPNAEEKQLLRYYYYIKHGIDTAHVAPMDKRILNKILNLIPKRLTKWHEIIDTIITELKSEYIFGTKKAVVDFILGGSLDKSFKIDDNFSSERKELKETRHRYLHHIRENRIMIKRNLYTINPCLGQMLELWQSVYTKLHFISIEELLMHSGAFDLTEFINILCQQIEDMKKILSTKWYETLKTIILNGLKRKCVPDTTKMRCLQHFLHCIAAQMTHNLQDIAIRSLHKFTEFMCDESNPGIRLHVLLEDEDKLVFSPTFVKIQTEILQIIDNMLNAVQNFERIELKMTLFESISRRTDYLKPIIPAQLVENCRNRIFNMLEEQRIGPELRLQDFDDYMDLMNGIDADRIYNFMNENPKFNDYCELINHYNDIEHEISMNVWGIVSMGFYEFNRLSLINTLETLARFMQTELLTKMVADQQADMAKLQNEYENISRQSLTIPKNTAELMNSKAYVTQMQNITIPAMENRLKVNLDHFLWLMDQTIYTPLEIKQNSITFQWYLKMPTVFMQNKKIIDEKTSEYQELLRKRIEQFRRDLDVYWEQLLEYENWGDIVLVAKYKRKANFLDNRLTAALEKIERINEEETSYEWSLSEYPLRKQTYDKLVPYKKLFDAGQDFIEKRDLWLKSQVGSFDPVNIASDIEIIYEIVLKLGQEFEEHPQSKRLADDIKTIIDEFKLNMPIIQTLGNPGMKLRHWEQISEMVGFPITVSAELTLEKIIEFGLEDYLARFEKISQSATKENGLEMAMSNMVIEWQGVEFVVNEYSDTGTYILASVLDIQTLLDDHIIKTQTMKNSPYIKPFETEILAWESKLVLLQDILDDWLRVQVTWIYLEPIFSSPDIQQQMPEEGRRFSAVDKIWKDLMKQVHCDPSVMSVVKIDKMSEKLKKAFNLLEIIQKGLNTYLEKKRLYFPRFFFLSNDGLLEILAETKDPTKVQSHLKKCFDGIHSLRFNESLEVTAMQSVEGEQIEFENVISTSKARGQVEKWLLELEKNMRESVLNVIRMTYEASTEQPHATWILEWPGQCIYTISLVNWTKEIDTALMADDVLKSLKEISNRLENETNELMTILQDIVMDRHRITMQALIIIYAQTQNVLNKLIEINATTLNEFHWLSQLRYFFDSKNIKIRMLNTTLRYGYEYVGNKSRLVVTPLTDRCYRSIFCALHYHLGAALQGVAGIGKTELVKDLAKAMAKQCIVFNCSNKLDYLAMGKFFKGLSACGAWTCFDEFDRIDPDVLSVVAQQIQTIQQGIRMAKDSFTFDGTTLSLDSSCGIFITMSRNGANNAAKLPGNLKSLFRPVAMMVPDLSLIAKIQLYSYGFRHAKILAMKLVTLFRLCNEQMTQQSQYDFGMRSIKSILCIAKEQKRLWPDKNEEEIVAQIICDNNLSKLKPIDAEIFQRILSGIFPAFKTTETISSDFIQALNNACVEYNLDASDYFMQKVKQLYQMMLRTPGLMIIGEPFSGKTTTYRILAKTLALLEAKNLMDEHRPICTVINPKSLTIGQMYGEFDSTTHEWQDGILAINFREFANSNTLERKWLIFDGPIDNIWVENLNSVLDDNHKLCLMSGDIIYLQKTMNLIFEPLDLEAASPSTVSRCGIIYMQPESLGWLPLFNCWKTKLPSIMQDVNKQELTSLFMRFCPVLLWFIRKGGAIEMLSTTDSNLITSLMNLFDCFLDEYTDEKYTANLSELDIRAQIEGIFFFSCIWSFGGALTEQSRDRFSELFHGLCAKEFPIELYDQFQLPESLKVPNLQKPFIFLIPKSGSVFDYRFIKEGKGKWKLWSDEIALAPALARDIPVNQIIITTKETVRINTLLDLLVRHGKSTLLVGPTATGKTIYAIDYLTKKIDQNIYASICMNFSIRTTANQVQDIIMARLDKRRKGVFGPPLGRKCVIFLDDLSMPMHEECMAQTPVELMRMLLDHAQWYDRKSFVPIKLIDLQIMCAMSRPQLSGKTVTSRFLRHFNVLSIDEFSNDMLKSIFSKIVLWHLDARGFSKEFDPCIDEIVLGTLYIYNEARKVLLPTPAKSHYLFNVRDFSRVIQGVLLSVPEATEGIDAMRRLWAHEVLRVYGDRLIDSEDQKWLFDSICLIAETELHTNANELLERFKSSDKDLNAIDLRKLMYCDFTNPKADTRNYLEVQDLEELRYVVEGYLVEFNNMTKRPMNLVMFRYAIEHLSRICRVLKQPRSHALLIGAGGSGRQSYTRLAAHIMDYELFQIELTRNFGINEWQEYLKAMLLKISCTEAHGVFLFTDSQIKIDDFLEDINNLLKSGEILSLFSQEEIKEICEKMHNIDKQRDKSLQTDGSAKALYHFFISVIREQLHIILCMSPIGNRFRNYIRNYPAFINSCTIDWLHPWPDDALQSISNKFLADEALTDSERTITSNLLIEFQSSALSLADEYFIQNKQRVFIPPITYIDSINTFKVQLTKKKLKMLRREQHYRKSLDRLDESADQMLVMQNSIETLEPKLKTASEKVTKQISDVQSAQEASDEQREFVKQDEITTADHVAVASELSNECNTIMDDVMPLMQEAENALNLLTPADLTALRTMKSPPITVKIVMEAVCILKEIKTDKMSASTDEYWTASKKLLNDPKFLESLLALEKDSIPDNVTLKLQEKIIPNDAFDPDKVKLVSVACECLCRWIIAIFKYDKAAKIVMPKRIALKEAEDVRNASLTVLNSKIEELRMLEENLAEMQKELSMEKSKFELLKAEHEHCSKRLQRATEIVNSLGGEKNRWQNIIEEIQKESLTLLANTLVATAITAYLGQFSAIYRNKQIGEWIKRCDSFGLTCDSEFCVQNVFGDPVEVRSWNIFGLPNDQFSIENAIILHNTRRWTLMVDPQENANKWIKNLEKSNRLCIIRLNQPDYLRVLENAIQYGLPVLLENVGEELEPILESILFKEIFKQSGSMNIKLGDNIVEYNDAFKLYMTTKLQHPCYSAEISAKVAILNFAITDNGLHELLLGVIVARERPDVEAEKTQLIIQKADAKRTLRDEEEKTLATLSADKNILDDDAPVQAINTSKMMINELLEKLTVAKVTEKQIDTCRMAYTELAEHATVLYFTIAEMIKISRMYQYSLVWFIGHFTSAIDNTDKVDDVQQRIRDLIKYFTFFIYSKMCRSLYEKDKIIFSVLIAKNLCICRKQIDENEWLNLIAENIPSSDHTINANRQFDWLPEDCWVALNRLSNLKVFSCLCENILENSSLWNDYFDLTFDNKIDPPASFDQNLTTFQKLILFKCFQPTKLMFCIQSFIHEAIGSNFIEPPQFNLASAFADSTCCHPILFILSPEFDPMQSILDFADTQSVNRNRVQTLSLGQQQGLFALKLVEEGIKSGHWICLQNCHLAGDWMSVLERICENLAPDTTHPDFRLWLTSEPVKFFPLSVLQNCIKLVNEPPKQFRANTLRSFTNDPICNENWFNANAKTIQFKILLYSLCSFHAMLQERKRYASLGWNFSYDFNESDLRTSIDQLLAIMNECNEIPFPILQYVTAECIYGGHVADAWDRRCLNVLIKQFYSEIMFEESTDSLLGIAVQAPKSLDTYESYITHIQTLPYDATATTFGLHKNADIIRETNESNEFLLRALLLQSSKGDSEITFNTVTNGLILTTATNILSSLPETFDVDTIQEKHPVRNENCMNTVLIQEITQYNSLLECIRSTSMGVLKAIQGNTTMSEATEAAAISFMQKKIPLNWLNKSYPSQKSLGSYIHDLKERISFFQIWHENSSPTIFWLPAFFSPQAFFAGNLQNFSRQNSIPYNQLTLNYIVNEDIVMDNAPEIGCLINGLFLDGCAWCHDKNYLIESKDRILYDKMPTIWMKPIKQEDSIHQQPTYDCPVYKTLERSGMVSTSGYNMNFVTCIPLYCAPDIRPEEWILRGCALICQLNT